MDSSPEGRTEPDVAALTDAASVARFEQVQRIADQAYVDGDYEGAVAAWEKLHNELVAEGDRSGAARAAVMVATLLLIDSGLMALVRGWVRRAERLLDTETATHAMIAAVSGYERFMCGDMTEAGTRARRAVELGDRLRVPGAALIGRTCVARVAILDGDVADGMAGLEEVAALLMSGAVDPLTTGMMYCELICAAQSLLRHDLATEWTEVMNRWRVDAGFASLHGRCRVHRAELLRVSGPSVEAEREALQACEELRPWMRREFGWPLAELGLIRLRRGDLDGAEEALIAAHVHVWTPHPGLALLQLERGSPAAAAALIDEALAHPFEVPSKERPPFGELRLAPLYDAQSEIAYACGDSATCGSAAAALTKIAAAYPTPGLVASAILAETRAALSSGDPQRAAHFAGEAAAAWSEYGAPYETATARVLLGEAHRRNGRTELARLEWSAAEAGFRNYGAKPRAEQVADLDPTQEAPRIVAATRPAAERHLAGVFRAEGQLRVIEFAGRSVTVANLLGHRYLQRLLAEPGREFHVLDLVEVERGVLPAERVQQTGLPALDDEAREAYRRRLAEIDDDITEAEGNHDLGRMGQAKADRDYLIAELTRAVGLGGRTRTSGGTAERARTSVTRAVRYSLDAVSSVHPVLGAHLRHAVRTGSYCSYQPDPLAPVEWACHT